MARRFYTPKYSSLKKFYTPKFVHLKRFLKMA